MYIRLTPKEFNSYGSRRGNDAVMARGTFANIRLVNKLISKPGPRTLHIPSGEEVSAATLFRVSAIKMRSTYSLLYADGRFRRCREVQRRRSAADSSSRQGLRIWLFEGLGSKRTLHPRNSCRYRWIIWKDPQVSLLSYFVVCSFTSKERDLRFFIRFF